MMFTSLLSGAIALPALGGTLPPALVEFRFVERTGQTSVSSSDNVLDFAIQARVTGAAGLNQFAFSVRLPGEAKTSGTWGRGLISNTDGTYTNDIALNSTVGRGGIASTYTYLSSINGSFNGQPNGTVNTFSTSAFNELIGVAGATAGAALLRTPGIDVDGDGNPDTWSGNGSGTPPPNGSHAAVDPIAGPAYFAQNQFIDIYRFRFTATDLTARTLHFTLVDITSRTLIAFSAVGGQWGPQVVNVSDRPTISAPGLDIQVIPATPTVSVIALGCAIGARRRR